MKNVYEDIYLKQKAQKIITQQRLGKILISAGNGVNLPSRESLGAEITRCGYAHAYQIGSFGYLDYDMDTQAYIFTPKPDAKLPKALENYKPLKLVEAMIDEAARLATVKVDEETAITFPGVEVWKDLYEILKELNSEAEQINAGVVIWRVEMIPDPDRKKKPYWNKRVPMVRNGEVGLPVTGYAYSDQSRLLAYLGVVGYKTSVESLRATLIQNKVLNLDTDGYHPMSPCEKYEQVLQALPEYTSTHSAFIAHQALPGKWSPEHNLLFLLVFRGSEDPDADLIEQFTVRLNEALEVPIIPEWGLPLFKAAKARNFIGRMETGGDCLGGVWVNLANDWNGLIGEMIKEGNLTVS